LTSVGICARGPIPFTQASHTIRFRCGSLNVDRKLGGPLNVRQDPDRRSRSRSQGRSMIGLLIARPEIGAPSLTLVIPPGSRKSREPSNASPVATAT
jgi:hypothetical protein